MKSNMAAIRAINKRKEEEPIAANANPILLLVPFALLLLLTAEGIGRVL